MNITKTSEDLFLHRSTLLERLKRIENLLQADLSDPDQRLRLLILLKIMETNANITINMRSDGFHSDEDASSNDPRKLQQLESIYKDVH